MSSILYGDHRSVKISFSSFKDFLRIDVKFEMIDFFCPGRIFVMSLKSSSSKKMEPYVQEIFWEEAEKKEPTRNQ
jgi:hypothetical protein